MKLRTVFLLNTIVALIYALGAFLMPERILELHGLGTEISTIWMARFFAVEMLGVGMVTWFARSSKDSPTRRSIVLGLLLHDLAGAIIAMWATLTDGMSAMGWLPFTLYLLFLIGYTYIYFKNKEWV